MRKTIQLLLLMASMASMAGAQTVTMSYVDDAAARADGWFIAHQANCAPNLVNGLGECAFDQDYYRLSRCQNGTDASCHLPGDQDQPCDTSTGHPGQWCVPKNFGHMLSGEHAINTYLHPLAQGYTSVVAQVTGVANKAFTSCRGATCFVHPTLDDQVGYGGLILYADGQNYVFLGTGMDPITHATFFLARVKIQGNYWARVLKVPVVFGTDKFGNAGVDWHGNLRIDNAGGPAGTFTFYQTSDVLVTATTAWSKLGTLSGAGGVGLAPLPLMADFGFHSYGVVTSSTSGVTFGSFTVN